MTTTTTTPRSPARRRFMATSSAAAGGLMLGFHVPMAQSQGAAPEINVWVLIKPDETVVVRIARSEMGQGTLTGLAQLVAEELQCDWARVTTEYPTPGQNLARKRVWRDMSTGGSRGIRGSQDYVRQGGAAARRAVSPGSAAYVPTPSTCVQCGGRAIRAGASSRWRPNINASSNPCVI